MVCALQSAARAKQMRIKHIISIKQSNTTHDGINSLLIIPDLIRMILGSNDDDLGANEFHATLHLCLKG